VEEAQESIRTLFDPLAPLPPDDPPARDAPARPGSHPLGRSVAEARPAADPAPDPGAAPPTVGESAVEAEVWRAEPGPTEAASSGAAAPPAPPAAAPVAPEAPTTSGRVLVRAARVKPGSGGGTPG
jgi:hypothetical protein